MRSRSEQLLQLLRRSSGGLLLLALTSLLALAAVNVATGRYQAHPVLTGSMEPGFSLGSIVVVKRVPISSLDERDVIIFQKPSQADEQVVHRIVKIKNAADGPIIQTQGDNNAVRDPWKFVPKGNTIYQAEYTVPFVGYAALWAHNPNTRKFAILAGGALLLILAMRTLFRKEASQQQQLTEEAGVAPDSLPSGTASVSDIALTAQSTQVAPKELSDA